MRQKVSRYNHRIEVEMFFILISMRNSVQGWVIGPGALIKILQRLKEQTYNFILITFKVDSFKLFRLFTRSKQNRVGQLNVMINNLC